MAALVARHGQEPDEVSPLSLLAGEDPAGELPTGAEELDEAIALLAAPERIVTLRMWPQGGDEVQFYGRIGTPRLVMLGRPPGEDEIRLIWPVTEAVLAGLATASLTSRAVREQAPFSLELSFSDLLMLSSIVDLRQEALLHCALDRITPQRLQFGEEELAAVYRKGMGSADPAWMVSRLGFVFEQGLPEWPGTNPQLLEALSNAQLLEQQGTGHTILPPGDAVFGRLAEVDELSIIVTRHRAMDEDDSGWTIRQSIFQSAPAQLWHYSLDNKQPPATQVRLETISASEPAETVVKLLRGEPLWPDTDQVAAGGFCAECGARHDEGQKFCRSCGNAL
ncbi:MAG: zinc ribbon domain-containing protein [Novosphingobium sp.]|nr:zinc ribbon domain-containing protein [Novosphingobium sp.]